MFTLRRHIDIPAPAEEVFAFHLDPRNLLGVGPPDAGVSAAEDAGAGG